MDNSMNMDTDATKKTMHATGSYGYWFCNVCNRWLPLQQGSALKGHLEGEKHKKKARKRTAIWALNPKRVKIIHLLEKTRDKKRKRVKKTLRTKWMTNLRIVMMEMVKIEK
jgi:hypothetical protein